MKLKFKICGLIFLLGILMNTTLFADEISNKLTIIPDQIKIGAFYQGSNVDVMATIQPCDGAVIVLESEDEDVKLNRKGRVGILWMNVAQLTISGLPQVYILASTDKLDSIGSEQTLQELRLGLKALEPEMKIESEQPLTGQEFDEFLDLKEHRGTYDTDIRIDNQMTSSGLEKLSANLPIPSDMPPGTYEIYLYCFDQGNLRQKMTAQINIERIGLPHFMINMATNHAAAYGLLAIFVAMGVGIVMGVIFSSLPGSGH